jgi:quercetin dioxygenase-like cupin family protein
MQYVFDTRNTTGYRFPTHVNDLVMDRSHATTSEVFIVELAPGEAPPVHQHDDMEQIFYVLQGRGRLDVGTGDESYLIGPGDVVRIPVSIPHTVHCVGDQLLRYLAVDCFTAGRPADEPTWEDHVRVICAQQGWRFEDVREP